MKDHRLGMEGKGFASSQAAVQSTLLGELIDNVPIGVIAFDGAQFVAANEHACALLGYRRDELIGRRIGDRHPFSAAPAGGCVELARKDGSPLEIECRLADSRVAGVTIRVALFWPSSGG